MPRVDDATLSDFAIYEINRAKRAAFAELVRWREVGPWARELLHGAPCHCIGSGGTGAVPSSGLPCLRCKLLRVLDAVMRGEECP